VNASSLFSNPLVRLEFMRRFRGGLAAWGIPLMVFLPGVAVVIAYLAGTSNQQNDLMDQGFGGAGAMMADGISVNQVDNFGEPMFFALMVTALLALMVLVPAVLGGSIASERDAQTLQPLQLTSLRPSDIVAGKLVSSLAYLLLLLTCLAPAMTIPFLVGGVTLSGVLKSFGLLFLVCVELAAMALAISAALRRSVSAIITSLLATGFLMVGPFVMMGVAFMVGSRNLGFQGDRSVLRLLGSFSPVSLFSWVGTVGSVDTGGFAGTSGRVWSLVWWAVITFGSLLIARRSVTAPTVRDR
jgi:ABC-type transport system involved in multi-copper enzyme maturation permease subunit